MTGEAKTLRGPCPNRSHRRDSAPELRGRHRRALESERGHQVDPLRVRSRRDQLARLSGFRRYFHPAV